MQAHRRTSIPHGVSSARHADRTAAEQIVQALRLPQSGPEPAPPRPLPLSSLPRLPREASMLYCIGRLDRSGRITIGSITEAV